MVPDELTPAPAPASFLSRLLAFAFDLLPALAMAVATPVALTWRLGLAPDAGWPFSWSVGGWGLVAGFGFALLYHTLLEGLWGTTPGKLLVRAGIARTDYTRCGLARAFARNLLWIIDVVGWVGIATTGARQRWGDVLAGTRVVERQPGPAVAGRAALATLALTLALAAGAWFAVRAERLRLRLIHPLATSLSDPGKPAGSAFQPGERVLFTFGLAGFRGDGPGGAAALEVEVYGRAANDMQLAIPWRKRIAPRSNPGQRQMNVRVSMLLGDLLPLGPAQFEVKVRDVLQDRQITYVHPFRLESPGLAPSESLDVRDLEASDLPDGPYPALPRIRQGQALYFRMKVFGAAFHGDMVGIQVDGRLVDGAGKLLVEQRSFLTLQGSFPDRPSNFYAPLSGRMRIASSLKPGPYRLGLTVRDAIGGQRTSRVLDMLVVAK